MTDNNKKLVGWAAVVIAIIGATFLGVRFPIPDAPPLDDELAGAALRQAQFQSVKVNQDLTVTGDATVGDDLTITDAADVGGALTFGATNLYPVGNTADGKKTIYGITTGVVQSATVVPTVSYISTVTAFGCAVDDAAFGGAWDCRGAMGASNNITFTLYEVDATPVPTAAYDQIRYWVAGN